MNYLLSQEEYTKLSSAQTALDNLKSKIPPATTEFLKALNPHLRQSSPQAIAEGSIAGEKFLHTLGLR